jgi:hypothetical protein
MRFRLCVPKTSSALIRGGNRLTSAHHDFAASRDPIRMKIRLSQGLIYPSLVGAKCSASLEQQDNSLELRPYVFLGVGLV